MISFLIKRTTSVIIFFAGIILLGIVLCVKTPISPLPEVDIPEITIHLYKHDAAAQQIETGMVRPLMQQLKTLNFVEALSSTSSDGYAKIQLRFRFGLDVDFAFLEVNEKIDFAMRYFPIGAERPRAVKSNTGDIPAFYINMFFHERRYQGGTEAFNQLSEYAENVVKRKLEQLPEVTMVDMTGRSRMVMHVVPDADVLEQLGVSVDAFSSAFSKATGLIGNAVIKDGSYEYQVVVTDHPDETTESIRNRPIKINKRVFSVSELAEVLRTVEKRQGYFLVNGQNAINLAVIKQSDASAGELREKVDLCLKMICSENPDIDFEYVNDNAKLLNQSIASLKNDVVYGALAGLLFILLFLRNWLSAAMLIIILPVSLLLTLTFFNLLGLSINILSLAGLALGTGLMIDNAIIVIDSISGKLYEKTSLFDSCVIAVSELIRPMLSSALTTCSVFVPLVYLSGIAGALFTDQAIAITVGLSVSLVVSITLLPVLFYNFHKATGSNKPKLKRNGRRWILIVYESVLSFVFRHKLATLLTCMSFLIFGYFASEKLDRQVLPTISKEEPILHIDWNDDISLDDNYKRTIGFLQKNCFPAINYYAFIGSQDYLLNKNAQLTSSEVSVCLATTSGEMVDDAISRIKAQLARDFPLALLDVTSSKNIFELIFGDWMDDLVLEIYPAEHGNNNISIADIDRIAGALKKMPHIQRIGTVGKQRVLNLNLNREIMYRNEVDFDILESRLSQYFGVNGSTENSNRLTQARVMPDMSLNNLKNFIGEFSVENETGGLVPLYNLATLTIDERFKHLYNNEHGRYVPIKIISNDPAKTISDAKVILESFPSVKARFSGNYFYKKKLVKEMLWVLGVSFLLLYFILAIQFESLLQPLIILSELPLGICGALIALFLFGSSLNIMSLIGIVMITGIIINDSILKIDSINRRRSIPGNSLENAIHEGSESRLNAILMTSGTTILSVIPFLFTTDDGSKLQFPLTLTIIGGMTLGTLVSLFFVPLVYWFCYNKPPVRRD